MHVGEKELGRAGEGWEVMGQGEIMEENGTEDEE